MALVGTGIIAVVDRTHDGSGDTAYTTARASQGGREASPASAEPQRSAVAEAPRRSAPASAEPAPDPAGEPRETASTNPPARPPVLPLAPSPGRQAPAAADMPDTTASFTSPAPPARPSPAPAVPAPLARAPVNLDGGSDGGCVPDELRTVLADMGSRFGKIAIVSTNELHTDNHSSGSIREKLHHACKAVDFRPERGRMNEIAAYLRTRPEVAGINTYRNGIVHMDLNEGSRAAGRRPPRQLVRRGADPAAPEHVEPLPPPPAASAFAPTLPDRDH